MDLAHDVERPLTYGDWLCHCHGCCVAVEATARVTPDLPLVIKWGTQPRTLTTVARWVREGCDAYAFSRQADDYVREVFIGAGR